MPKETKKFKDPIYGYIEIKTAYVEHIIDSPEFQRLRRVVQTSYSPLYSSSVHNRFIHSLGVYHLGEMAINNIINNLNNNIETLIGISANDLKEVFLLACLLHDVGHAPFSHTGEKFYLTKDEKYTDLHSKLVDSIGDNAIEEDIPEDSKAAAPHEIMSAIVALNKFGQYFDSELKKELFARCITGYKYKIKTDVENSIIDPDSDKKSFFNCIISCLNSKVIDVDRLDYLIRDAYFSGFETINIDYIRLLSSLIVKYDDNEYGYKLCYLKNAISIIENVVYAYDSERKWIQTHPIVLYDMYLLQHIIGDINKEYSKEDYQLFSYESLSIEGVELAKNTHVSLLSDDDIMYFLKNMNDNRFCKEYFFRSDRPHTLWKSEAEFKAYICVRFGKGSTYDQLLEALDNTATYIEKNFVSGVINENLIQQINEELNNIETDNTIKNQASKSQQIKVKKSILKVLNCLKKFADENNSEFDFILLRANQFYSGFNKMDFEKIKILFPESNDLYNFGDVVTTLGSEKDNDKFFYMYYREKSGGSINRIDLCKALYTSFLS